MTERATAGGAVVAGLLVAGSWLCCLPLALGSLGAVVVGVAAQVGAFRGWISALSLVLLGAATAQAVRRPACSGDVCTTSRGRRIGLVLVAGVITLALLTLPYWASFVVYWSM